MENGKLEQPKYRYTLPLAMGLFVISMMALTAAVTYYYLVPPSNGSLLGEFFSPRTVLTRVPGMARPSVIVEGEITIRGERCIKGDAPIIVQQFLSFQSASSEDGRISTVRGAEYGKQVSRQPGCVLETMLTVLPPQVEPGIWHIESVERAITTGEFRSWFSEDFEVVNR